MVLLQGSSKDKEFNVESNVAKVKGMIQSTLKHRQQKQIHLFTYRGNHREYIHRKLAIMQRVFRGDSIKEDELTAT